MVPTVLERSSWIDRERPVRLYRFDEKGKHKTVRLTYKMGSNDYWGVQESDWEDAPVLGSRNFVRNIGGRTLRAVLQRAAPPHGRPQAGRARATGSSTRCSTGSRTRRCSRSPRACGRSRKVRASASLAGRSDARDASRAGTLRRVVSASPSRVAVFGAGYVGLVTGACFAELGHSVVVRDVLPERIAALQRGEVPIYEPGLAELIARNAERLAFTTDVAEAIDGADFVYVAVGTPPTYSGDADLSAVWTVIDELPAIDRRCVVVMKSTVPVGTGLEGASPPRRARARPGRLRLEPRVHRRGHGGRRTSCIPTGSSSARSATRTATPSRRCTPASTAPSSAATSRPPR